MNIEIFGVLKHAATEIIPVAKKLFRIGATGSLSASEYLCKDTGRQAASGTLTAKISERTFGKCYSKFREITINNQFADFFV
jgi:hypothetical protein